MVLGTPGQFVAGDLNVARQLKWKLFHKWNLVWIEPPGVGKSVVEENAIPSHSPPSSCSGNRCCVFWCGVSLLLAGFSNKLPLCVFCTCTGLKRKTKAEKHFFQFPFGLFLRSWGSTPPPNEASISIPLFNLFSCFPLQKQEKSMHTNTWRSGVFLTSLLHATIFFSWGSQKRRKGMSAFDPLFKKISALISRPRTTSETETAKDYSSTESWAFAFHCPFLKRNRFLSASQRTHTCYILVPVRPISPHLVSAQTRAISAS